VFEKGTVSAGQADLVKLVAGFAPTLVE